MRIVQRDGRVQSHEQVKASDAGLDTDLLRALNDRELSANLSDVVYRDSVVPVWNDQLSSLGSWTTAGSPTVSGGKVYATTSAAISAMTRDVDFSLTDSFRYVAQVDFKTGLAANRMSGILVTTDTAATIAATGSMTNSIAIAIDCTTSGARKVFATKQGTVTQMAALSDANQTLAMGISWDPARGCCVWARQADTYEAAMVWSVADLGSFLPTRVGWFSVDNRGSASATGYGPFGFRASPATIEPRTGLEGVHPTLSYGKVSSIERSRVLAPAAYDSRIKSPLLIVCHGGGQDLTHAITLADAFASSGFIVASGDFTAGGANNAMGAPDSIDEVVNLYTWCRDRYNIGPVFMAGYSMGGMTILQTVMDGRVPGINGCVIGAGDFDLHWVWEVGTTDVRIEDIWPDFKAAWGVVGDTEAEWLTATDGYDPMLAPPEAFRGIPFLVMSSPDDTWATEEDNALPWVARMQAAGAPVEHLATSGEHDSALQWPHATILAWMTAKAYTT